MRVFIGLVTFLLVGLILVDGMFHAPLEAFPAIGLVAGIFLVKNRNRKRREAREARAAALAQRDEIIRDAYRWIDPVDTSDIYAAHAELVRLSRLQGNS